jgi:hypothetical protein
MAHRPGRISDEIAPKGTTRPHCGQGAATEKKPAITRRLSDYVLNAPLQFATQPEHQALRPVRPRLQLRTAASSRPKLGACDAVLGGTWRIGLANVDVRIVGPTTWPMIGFRFMRHTFRIVRGIGFRGTEWRLVRNPLGAVAVEVAHHVLGLRESGNEGHSMCHATVQLEPIVTVLPGGARLRRSRNR